MNSLVNLFIVFILLLSLFIWYRQRVDSFDAEAVAKRDITSWLLISLLMIVAFGFGALLVYILL